MVQFSLFASFFKKHLQMGKPTKFGLLFMSIQGTFFNSFRRQLFFVKYDLKFV
ncbi:hypothetical protein RV01_GL000083 [Enterococcus dispar]|nr:hypothetical protein RV01_GL000083 [Enterococcus dispar]